MISYVCGGSEFVLIKLLNVMFFPLEMERQDQVCIEMTHSSN